VLTWWMAEPFWTRMLWPRPRSLPSLDIRAAPIYFMLDLGNWSCEGRDCLTGTPASSYPIFASSTAMAKPS
jgi:hypothetical protein